MGTGGTPALQSPKSENRGRRDESRRGTHKCVRHANIDGQQVTNCAVSVYSTFYGQAERAISNGQLNVLLRLHIRPINVVVFHGPY